MSLETFESTSLQIHESFSSWQVWKTIFVHPKVEVYQTLIDDPRAGFKRGLWWVVLANLLGYSVLMVPVAVFPGALALGFLFDRESIGLGIALLVFTAALIPLMVFWGVAAGLIHTGVCHLISRLLGGTGPYGKLYYLFAAYLAPFNVVFCIVGIIPFMSMLLLPVAWYGVYIQVVAVKTVHQISWEKAVGTIAVPILMNVVIMFGIFALVLIMTIIGFYLNYADFSRI